MAADAVSKSVYGYYKGYRQNMKNYVINSLGDMYMEEVTADDIRLALVPLSQNRKDCMIR